MVLVVNSYKKHKACKMACALPADVSDVFASYAIMNPAGHDMFVRACRVAAPIMRKRMWKVGKLKEFFPANPGLLGLNVNRGKEVCVRLRTSEHNFLEFESILHTLLHELVHIVHGNHSAAFYEMLDELIKEAESVDFRQRHNVSDVEGRYWGEGKRLGGKKREGFSTSTSSAAAIGEGKRLGGSRTFGLSAKEAARQATLRRMQDKVCCGTYEDEVQFVPTPPPAAAAAKPVEVIDLESPQRKSSKEPTAKRVILDLTNERWICPRCTFENIEDHLQCFFCFQVKS